MTNHKENVKDVLEAIDSVRSRAKAAMKAAYDAYAASDMTAYAIHTAKYANLIADLAALERCLVGEATKLLIVLDRKPINDGMSDLDLYMKYVA